MQGKLAKGYEEHKAPEGIAFKKRVISIIHLPKS
jgi:hypothetical protein